MNRRESLGALLAGFTMAGLAHAEDASFPSGYPSRPIRLIVPFPPGGGSDNIGRKLASRLSERLGQPVVVENRAGAGGLIGTEFVAKAAPDGHTLVLAVASHAIYPHVYRKIPFDPINDFSAVTLIAWAPNVLTVNSSLPARTVSELIELARRAPGTLNYSSSGNGTTLHLAGEYFKLATSTSIVHIPYKGGGPAMTALLAGEVSMMFNTMPSTMPFINSDKVRPLAVTSLQRSPLRKDLPTLHESGLQDFDVRDWYGVLAPAGTSARIVRGLQKQIATVVAEAEFSEQMLRGGFVPVAGDPESFTELIKGDLAKWEKVVRAADIQPG